MTIVPCIFNYILYRSVDLVAVKFWTYLVILDGCKDLIWLNLKQVLINSIYRVKILDQCFELHTKPRPNCPMDRNLYVTVIHTQCNALFCKAAIAQHILPLCAWTHRNYVVLEYVERAHRTPNTRDSENIFFVTYVGVQIRYSYSGEKF